MWCLAYTGIPQHFPALNLYQFQICNVIDTACFTKRYPKFIGWIHGIYHGKLLYTPQGDTLMDMIEIERVKHAKRFIDLIPVIYD